MSDHGLVGYSQDPPSNPGKSEEAAVTEEFEAIKPRAEERAKDAAKKTSAHDASNAEYGPNQRSEAWRRGQEASPDVGRENFASQTKTVPESAHHPDYTGSEGTPKTHDLGKEVPSSINPSSKEPNPGDYYGSTGGY
ncbi:hypothetical protein ABW20_dc0100388 [Dactylellina cionopaga]|nr:hypothetical protein ABW20_dc0100388 [Dactylellina cionopaga]